MSSSDVPGEMTVPWTRNLSLHCISGGAVRWASMVTESIQEWSWNQRIDTQNKNKYCWKETFQILLKLHLTVHLITSLKWFKTDWWFHVKKAVDSYMIFNSQLHVNTTDILKEWQAEIPVKSHVSLGLMMPVLGRTQYFLGDVVFTCEQSLYIKHGS